MPGGLGDELPEVVVQEEDGLHLPGVDVAGQDEVQRVPVLGTQEVVRLRNVVM